MFSSMAFMLGPTGASCLQEVISPRTPINRNSVGVRMACGCVSSKVTRISTCSWRNVSSRSLRRPVMITRWPSAAKRRAVASPKPLVAPVMRMVLGMGQRNAGKVVCLVSPPGCIGWGRRRRRTLRPAGPLARRVPDPGWDHRWVPLRQKGSCPCNIHPSLYLWVNMLTPLPVRSARLG